MPTYQYSCTECGHAFEQVQSFTDDALTECPECQGRLRKLFNAVGVVFKGSGFYRTDSRGPDKSDSSGSSSGSNSGTKDSKDTKGATDSGSSSSGSSSGASGSGSGSSSSSGSSTSSGSGSGSSPSTKAPA